MSAALKDEKATSTSQPSNDYILEFQNLSHFFVTDSLEVVHAVKDVNLGVSRSKFTCVIGPSGCGKSTLLNFAAGLAKPTNGDVLFNGEPIRKVNTSVGFLRQENFLLPWRTVEANIELALELKGTARSERKSETQRILELVGLGQAGKRYPYELSGGMQKRVALGRLLITAPETMLMDEPFGALDAQTRTDMQNELLDLWSKDRRSVIFVTHDLEEAILLADEIVVFGKAPGTIIHHETVNLERPRDLVQLRQEPEFGQLWAKLWSLVEGQRQV